MTARQVAVGGQRRAGAGVAAKETSEPGEVAVAQPLVLRQAKHAQPTERFEQVAWQRSQIVVVQRSARFTHDGDDDGVQSEM